MYAPADQDQKNQRLMSGTVKPVLDDATQRIIELKEEFSRLVEVASKHPFYKYNGVWSRELQNLVSGRVILGSGTASLGFWRYLLTVDRQCKVYYIELCAWLGGLEEYKGTNSSFLTIEEVGKFLDSEFRLLDCSSY